MIILGIDTSCDDTSISLVKVNEKQPSFTILTNTISSQINIHKQYGGVFPALAKRAHQQNLTKVLGKALTPYLKPKNKITQLSNKEIKEILIREQHLLPKLMKFFNKYKKPKIDYIAVTVGPGLEPCLWTGINFAKALSHQWNIPLIPVNHMEGHICANRLNNQEIKYPAISLLVSGGHTQLILSKKEKHYQLIGETRDDAAGECFDKVARILGLDYPGGPIIEKLAKEIKESSITLPRPMMHTKDFDFSFSGLKTAVLYEDKKHKKTKKYIKEMAKEAQTAIFDVLIKKTLKAAKFHKAKTIIIGGGVSASDTLKERFKKEIKDDYLFVYPEKKLSTDNAAMIAVAGYLNINNKKKGFVANSKIKLC